MRAPRRQLVHRVDEPRAWAGWPALGLLLAYVAAAVLVQRNLWVDPAHRVSAANPGDSIADAWLFASAPHELLHARDPWISHAIGLPVGVNLGWSPAVVPIALLFAPVTALTDPLTSVALAMTLALATSAWSLAMVLGRLPVGPRPGRWAAALGGAVFGFSPALVAQSTGHLAFAALGLLPVVVLLVARLCVGQGDPLLVSLQLGVVVGIQALISEEVVLDAALVGLLLAWVLARRHPQVLRPRAPDIGAGLVIAAAVAAVLSFGLTATQVYGPAIPKGRTQDPDTLEAPLAGLWTSTPQQLLHGPGAAGHVARWQVSTAEATGYLGWPLLLLLAAGLVLVRRRSLRLLLLATAGATVLSLGRFLHVDGPSGDVHLPFALLRELPGFSHTLPVHWTAFTALGVAVAVAWIAQAATRARRWRLASAAVVLALLPLVPSAHQTDTHAIPGWFAGGARDVPDHSAALVLPLPGPQNPDPVLWQAAARLRFSMPGGFFVAPGPTGAPALGGAPLWTTGWLQRLEAGGTGKATRSTRAKIAADLATWGVRSIVVGPGGPSEVERAEVALLLGRGPDVVDHEVSVWLDVDPQAVLSAAA